MGPSTTSLLRIVAPWLALCGAALAQTDAATTERIERMLGGGASFEAAFEGLRHAVAIGDAATVASLVNYPITVEIDGERTVLRREADLVGRYAALFTPELARIVTEQDYAALDIAEDGIRFGDGEIRMAKYCTDRACRFTYWLVRAIAVPE